MPTRPTIIDVARRSGVSTATVSRILAGDPRARETTRDRVVAAARELDYRPSAVARALKRAETRTLGLLVTDIGNPFFPQVVRTIEDEAHARGYGVLLCNAADDPDREMAYLEVLLERRVDGLIVASARATRRHARRLAAAPMAVVLVNSDAPGSRLPAVMTAHRAGARAAAEHLLQLGHRRIGWIGAPGDRAAAAGERRRGVIEALRAAGIDRASLVEAEGDEHVDGAMRAAVAVLSRRDRPTGIVCYNDLTAIGAMLAAEEAGLAVPGDVSIVGFDDIEMAAWTRPALTTVRQPTAELARWAVDRVLAAIGGEDGRPRRATLRPELVVRASTGPAPVT